LTLEKYTIDIMNYSMTSISFSNFSQKLAEAQESLRLACDAMKTVQETAQLASLSEPAVHAATSFLPKGWIVEEKTQVSFEAFTQNVRWKRWGCCSCGNINIGKRTHCVACDIDVAKHTSTHWISNGRDRALMFGIEDVERPAKYQKMEESSEEDSPRELVCSCFEGIERGECDFCQECDSEDEDVDELGVHHCWHCSMVLVMCTCVSHKNAGTGCCKLCDPSVNHTKALCAHCDFIHDLNVDKKFRKIPFPHVMNRLRKVILGIPEYGFEPLELLELWLTHENDGYDRNYGALNFDATDLWTVSEFVDQINSEFMTNIYRIDATDAFSIQTECLETIVHNPCDWVLNFMKNIRNSGKIGVLQRQFFGMTNSFEVLHLLRGLTELLLASAGMVLNDIDIEKYIPASLDILLCEWRRFRGMAHGNRKAIVQMKNFFGTEGVKDLVEKIENVVIPSLITTGSKINTVAETFSNGFVLSPEMEKFVDRKFEDFATKLNQNTGVFIDDKVDKVFKRLRGLVAETFAVFQLQGSMLIISVTERLIGFILGCVAAYKCEDLTVRKLIISSIVFMSGVTSSVVGAVVSAVMVASKIGSELPGHIAAHVQADGDVETNLVSTLFDAFVMILTGKTESREKDFRDHISSLRGSMGVVKDAVSFATLIVDVAKKAVAAAYEITTGVPLVTDAQKPVLDRAVLAIDVASKLVEGDSLSRLGDIDFCRQVVAASDECDHVLTEMTRCRLGLPAFTSLLTPIRSLKDRAVSRIRSANARVEPVWIHLIGSPGVGKSVLSTALAVAIFNSFDLRLMESSFFYRTGDSEYWDGYKNQSVVIWDDLFQIDTAESVTSTAAELIRAKNTASYPLNMAFDKGDYFFDSPLIISSSNVKKIPEKGGVLKIADPDALRRRRDLVIEVEAAVERDSVGRIKVLDKNFNPARYKFTMRNIMDKGDFAQSLTWDELVRMCVDTYGARRKSGASIISQILGSQNPDLAIAQAGDDEVPANSEKVEMQEVKYFERKVEPMETSSFDPPITEWKHKNGDVCQICTKMCNFTKQGGETKREKENIYHKIESQEVKSLLVCDCDCLTCAGRKPENWHARRYGYVLWDDAKAHWLKAKEKFISVVKQTGEMHPLKLTMVVLATVGTVMVAGALVNKLFKKKGETQSHQDAYSFKASIPTNSNTVPLVKRFVSKEAAHAQAGDTEAENVMRNVLPRNSCIIQVDGVDGKRKMVRGLFIAGRILITANHIFEFQKPNTPVTIIAHTGIYQLDNAKDFVVTDDDEDIALVRILNPSVPLFRNIVSHFVSTSDLRKQLGDCMAVYVHNVDIHPLVRYGNNARVGLTLQYSNPLLNKLHTIAYGATMFVPTIAGECGAPWVVLNPHVHGKIFGIHVAGTGSTGYSSIITREMLEQVLANVQAGTVENLEIPSCFIPTQGEVVRVVSKQDAYQSPGVSRIVPTLLKDVVVPHSKEPARLHPYSAKTGERIDPMANAMGKFELPVVHYRSPNFDFVADFMRQMQTRKVAPMVLSLDEAINGVAGWEYLCTGLKMGTSMGYPRCKQTGGKPGKTAEFTLDEKTQKWSPSQSIIVGVQKLKDGYTGVGTRVEVLVCDALKDELRDIPKVNYPRIFNPMPVEHTLLARQYLGAFVENEMRNHRDGSSQVGINPKARGDWEYLYRRLTKYGPNTPQAPGDYNKFDARHMYEFACEFVKQVNHYYSLNGKYQESQKVDDLIRFNLVIDCVLSLHINGNVVYRLKMGNTSGNFVTTMFNNYVAEFIFRDAVAHAEPEIDKTTAQKAVDIVVFGDDNNGIWPPEWENMSMSWIRDVAAKYGHVYTDCFKSDGEMSHSYLIGDIEFLKRRFLKRSGIIFAPLRKSVLYEIPQWRQKWMPNSQALPLLLEVAYQEAAMWGPEFFEAFKKEHDDAMRELGYQPPVVIYQQCIEDYCNGAMSQLQDAVVQSGSLDEKREINDPHETVATLTTFTDTTGMSEPSVEELRPISKIHIDTDPYPDQGLKQVLERMYPVQRFTWSGADPSGTLVTQLDFPDALYQIPRIQTALDTFQYFRAGVELQFRINGVIFHYGRLLVAWQPHFGTPTTVLNPFQGLYQSSNCPTVRISPNTNVVTSFTIPFVGNRDYWNMKDASDGVARGLFGSIAVFVEHPLLLSGATSTPVLDVLVYARFVNPEVAGMGTRNATPAVVQSGTVLEEQTKKSKEGTISGIVSASTHLMTNIAKFPFTPGPARGIASMLAKAGYTVMSLLGKPTSVSEIAKVMLVSNTGLALCDGLDGTQKLSMDPRNTVSTDWTLYNSARNYDLFDEYKLLPSLIFVGSFDSSTVLGTRILTLGVNPLACNHGSTVGGTYFVKSHLANLAHLFTYWRGGIKFRISFSSSRVLSTRLRIMWLPDPTYTAALASDEEGNIVSKVVDITGDVSTDFVVPYLREFPWLPCGPIDIVNFEPITTWDYWNGQIVIQTVQPVSSNTELGSTSVYFSVWVSGAEDFQVAVPYTMESTILDGTTTELAYAQMGDVTSDIDLRQAFREVFKPIISASGRKIQGIAMGEDVQSFSQYLKRYTLYQSQSTSSTQNITPTIFVNGQNRPFALIVRSFLFNRGSVRMKGIVTAATSATPTDWQGRVSNFSSLYVASDSIGSVYSNSRLTNVIEAEIPYYTQENMNSMSFSGSGERVYPNGFTFSYTGIQAALSTVRIDYWISAGDDFTLGWPVVPIVLVVPEAKKTIPLKPSGNANSKGEK
jgi:hypothetical protein